MSELPKDWLTHGLIDYEYKKYIVLAYLKDVKSNFNNYILYPFLSDLVFHYKNLIHIKENKQLMYENFPKVISKADFEKLKITYKKIVQDDEVMKEIEDILEFSIARFKDLLNEGRDIYEFVEENVEITPIGVSPLYAKEGYLLIDQKEKMDMNVYRYLITVFENANETFRGVHTEYLETVTKSMNTTYETLKLDLIRKYSFLPNPATYLFVAKVKLPFEETLFPVAKRILVKYINTSQSY
jgi:hypothetical protein